MGKSYKEVQTHQDFFAYKIIDDNTLVALTLMIAESKSDDKDMMVKVIINLMNNK